VYVPIFAISSFGDAHGVNQMQLFDAETIINSGGEDNSRHVQEAKCGGGLKNFLHQILM